MAWTSTVVAGMIGVVTLCPPFAFADGAEQGKQATTHGDARHPAQASYGVRALQAMTGQVTNLDKRQGNLSLRTEQRIFELHFPPSLLRDVQEGDRLTLELGLREPTAGTAPPRTKSNVEPIESRQTRQ